MKSEFENEEILIFIPFIYGFGGVERLILSLSNFLYKNKKPHKIITFACSINLQLYANWNIKIEKLSCSRNSIIEIYELYKYIKKNSANGTPHILMFDLKSTFYSFLLKSSCYSIHLTDPPSLLSTDKSKHSFSLNKIYQNLDLKLNITNRIMSEIIHRINKRGAKRAKSVFVMTENISREINKIYNIRSQIIHPGINQKENAKRSYQFLLNKKVRFISISRIEHEKRLDWILISLSNLVQEGFFKKIDLDWRLNIIGDGSFLNELKKIAHLLKIDKNINFVGKISDEEVENLMINSDIFLMPAKQGYGLPALEAIAYGIPVILHNESGVTEVLKESMYVIKIDNGLLDLTNAIQKMIIRIIENKNRFPEFTKVPTAYCWAYSISKECNWV